jgi:hypothetical protein
VGFRYGIPPLICGFVVVSTGDLVGVDESAEDHSAVDAVFGEAAAGRGMTAGRAGLWVSRGAGRRRRVLSASFSRSLIGSSRSIANAFVTPRYASLSNMADHHAGVSSVLPERRYDEPSHTGSHQGG